MKSFASAYKAVSDEVEEKESFVEVRLDTRNDKGEIVPGRVVKIYEPNEGQTTFMLATMGRGQTDMDRVSGMINLLVNAMDDSDAEYFNSRLLTRDPQQMIGQDMIEGIFDYVIEAWFGVPTQGPSDSARTPQNTGQPSTPTTTPSRPAPVEVPDFSD